MSCFLSFVRKVSSKFLFEVVVCFVFLYIMVGWWRINTKCELSGEVSPWLLKHIF